MAEDPRVPESSVNTITTPDFQSQAEISQWLIDNAELIKSALKGTEITLGAWMGWAQQGKPDIKDYIEINREDPSSGESLKTVISFQGFSDLNRQGTWRVAYRSGSGEKDLGVGLDNGDFQTITINPDGEGIIFKKEGPVWATVYTLDPNGQVTKVTTPKIRSTNLNS